MTLEETLVTVWRQALEENSNLVEVDGQRFPVRRTQRHRLRQVDFEFGEKPMRGLEQNPATKSRWAELARNGKNVMQFLSGGRYIANVADGVLTLYDRSSHEDKKSTGKAATSD
jgi:hypothetical protein